MQYLYSTVPFYILDKVFYLPSTVQDQTNRKTGFTEHESLDKTLLSSSSYVPCGSDQPLPSTPTYEVVPVICHLKTMGNNKLPLQSHCLDKTLDVEHVSEANKHPRHSQDNNLLLDSFFELSQSNKRENSENDIPHAVAEEVEKFDNSCKIGQFQSSGSQTILALHSNTNNEEQCVHSTYTSSKHLSPEPDSRKSVNRCISDVDSVQSFNPLESEKHVCISGILSDAFSDKKSYNTTYKKSENTSHALSQHMTKSHKRQANLYLENSSSTDTNDTMCEKRTSDLNVWHKMGEYYAPTLEMLTAEKVALGEDFQKNSHIDCYEFSSLRKDCVTVHCLPESNDSDSDETCPGPNVDVKDGSEVPETIDVAEILISNREQVKSGPHNYSKTRRFQCSVPECEKAFSQRGSLNRHMRSHLGIRPYSCPLCTMTFSRQYRVTEHMRVHQRSCEYPP